MNENNNKPAGAPDDQDAALNFLRGNGQSQPQSRPVPPKAHQNVQNAVVGPSAPQSRAGANQPRKDTNQKTSAAQSSSVKHPQGQTAKGTSSRPLHNLQGAAKPMPQQAPAPKAQPASATNTPQKNQQVVPMTRGKNAPSSVPSSAHVSTQPPQRSVALQGQGQPSYPAGASRPGGQQNKVAPARNPAEASSYVVQRRGQSAVAAAQKHSASANAGDVQVRSGKRGENDDFEIDEATYAPDDSKKDGPMTDSATSAVMSLVKAVVYIVAVIAVSVGLAVFIIGVGNDVFKFTSDEKIVTVTIPEYATIDDITDALYDAGAIKYKWAFKMWSNLKTKGKNLEFAAGTYELSTSLNYDYLRMAFRKNTGSYEEVRITIPEGYTIDEIIDLFVSKGIGTKEGFVDAIQNYAFDYPFLEGLTVSPDRIYRLEGYLFPDTYNFYKESSEVAVLKKMLDNFNNKFVEAYYARCDQLGITVDEAIILASMIEKETRYADELGYVSSVFHNRLKYSATFPYLNSDATIMYAMQHDLGGRPDSMTGEDTEYKTPYNTYKNKGFPPGPIANPGLNSIKYALYPNDTKYFYFVSDSNGRMLFAQTEPEHLANINKVRGN